MSSQIKGLSQFIADVRATQSHEAERTRILAEIARLRQKMNSGGSKTKAGYELKKNAAKLLYVYILGYNVDFGSREMVALLKSSKYSEKQIGYLCLELILNESDMVVEDSMAIVIEDLRSPKELNTALALNYVSNLNKPDVSLVEEVFRLLMSPTSALAVARKAALCVTAFYRQDPTILRDEWYERIVALMDTSHLGLETSIADLVTCIAQKHPDRVSGAFSRAVRRLRGLSSGEEVPLDYLYYNIPAPWLSVKLLQLLKLWQPLPAPDSTEGQALRLVVINIIKIWATEIEEEGAAISQHVNARNAILYQALWLAARLDCDVTEQMARPMLLLFKSKDANTRYFALQALEVYPRLGTLSSVNSALALVRDRDTTLKRQALDALYNCCNSETVEHMAAELLDLLVTSELMVMPQMVARLAGIIERFATSERWYIDTTLSLLTLGGSYVGEETWQRFVQIVVNNRSIRPYACEAIFSAVKDAPQTSTGLADNILKAAAYILGEYGPPSLAMDIFLALQDHIDDASLPARRMLLITYAKLAARASSSAELTQAVLDVMQQRTRSADKETQQRACEFVVLLHPSNIPTLKAVCEEMPAFSANSSLPLFAKLAPAGAVHSAQQQLATLPNSNGSANASAKSSTANLHSLLTSNWEHGFRRMLTHSSAVLFQDSILQFGCQYEFENSRGKLTLHIRNMSAYPLTSLSAQVNSTLSNSVLDLETEGAPSMQLGPDRSTSFVVRCEALHPFAVSPTVRISYMAGALSNITLRLPIVLDRFLVPMTVTAPEFVQRWSQLGENQFQKKFRNWSGSKAQTEVHNDTAVVSGLNWGIVQGTPSTRVILAAAILHTTAESHGCLLKCELDDDRQNYSVSVRATNRLVAVILANDLAAAYTL